MKWSAPGPSNPGTPIPQSRLVCKLVFLLDEVCGVTTAIVHCLRGVSHRSSAHSEVNTLVTHPHLVLVGDLKLKALHRL